MSSKIPQEQYVKLKAPEGCSSLSWHGYTLSPDEDGTVEVPPAAVADLTPHGFTRAVAPKPEPVKKVLGRG